MNLLRNLSIQRKLLAITLLISGAVLTVALSVLFAYQVLNFRASFKRDTVTIAEIIANNSTAALAFEDTNAAAEILTSLKAKPTVSGACLSNNKGAIFAATGQWSPERLQAFGGDRQ